MTVEKHILSLEDYDVTIDVEVDGRVWIKIGESYITPTDLKEIVEFVEKHV